MAEKKRKSVIVETAKQMLVKIPEHLLAKVQAAVEAEQGIATPATDIEIIKAADKSSRTRCRKLHEEMDVLLHQLYAMLNETDRLMKAMTCSIDCHRSKKCVCGFQDLADHRNQLRGLHEVVVLIVNPPDEIPFRKKLKPAVKSAPPPRCGVCNEYELDCDCLTFNGELPDDEEEDFDDLVGLISNVNSDTTVDEDANGDIVVEHDGVRHSISPRRHPNIRSRRVPRAEGGRFVSPTPNTEEVEPDDDGE